jgi:hypothetical protein
MKKIGIVAVLSMLVLGAFTTGCGNGSSAVTCDVKTTTLHSCTSYDYSADTTGTLASLEASSCTAQHGTTGACPTTAELGTCTQTVSGYSSSVTYYSDTTPALTAAQAKTACGTGTWTAK